MTSMSHDMGLPSSSVLLLQRLLLGISLEPSLHLSIPDCFQDSLLVDCLSGISRSPINPANSPVAPSPLAGRLFIILR